MHDFNAGRAKRHEEREEAFGQKPFTFGYTPRARDEEGNLLPSELDETGNLKPKKAEVFFVRANVGYQGIKRVAALSASSSGEETFDAIETSVFSMIDPRDNALERFKGVTSNLEDPVTFDDLVELQGWLLEEQTNLPPTEPQPSAASSPTSGPSSTDPSSTGQEEVSTS